MTVTREEISQFTYAPLPVEENRVHVRLLLLQPGVGDSPITGKLINDSWVPVQRLDYKPISGTPYEALSYMWGAPEITHSILLDGHPFPVRENLWQALTHLRLEDRERALWIDALCINQEDLEEKNVQVAQMGSVYRTAKKTVVWLGEEELGLGRPACEVIKGSLKSTGGMEATKEFWMKIVGEWKARKEGDEGKSVPEWYALLKLVELGYWKRLWIVQEVVLSYSVEMYWGKGILQWEDIKWVMSGITDVEDDEVVGKEFQETSRALTDTVLCRLIGQKYGGGKVMHYGAGELFELLSEYQEARCFDLRDKVYGMKAICIREFPVDYSKTPAELCQRVVYDKFSVERTDFASRLQNPLASYLHLFQFVDAISGGEFVYKVLLESKLRPEDALVAVDKELELKSKILPTGCNISGEICFITETLDTYRGLSRESAREFLGSRGGPSTLSQETTMQLQYLCHLLNEASTLLPTVLGNPNTNRCHAICGTETYGEEQISYKDKWSAAREKWEKTEGAWKKEAEERSQATFPTSSQSLEEMTANLVFTTALNLDLNPSKETKIFFTASGLIGFAPANATQGDIICTFRQSRTFLVMRGNGEKYVPVGVASSFSRDLDHDSKMNVRAGVMGYDQFPERLMWLYLDIKTMQLLCSFDCEHSSDQTTLFRIRQSKMRALNPYAQRIKEALQRNS